MELSRQRNRGAGAFAARLGAAHFLAYPLIMWAAMTGMSVPILVSEEALLSVAGQTEPTSAAQRWLMAHVGLGAAEAASFEVIMRPLAVVLALLFLITHVAALPWARGARRSVLEGDPVHERRGRRVWLVASLGATALVTVVGLVGWARILLL